ncbi:hypothetical protein D5086_011558 [Populus alba]|uniref:Uncharacterized protein n=1 Tax=Populus alba TaxID=43335 RepID=A0ACC4CCW6_POPAL
MGSPFTRFVQVMWASVRNHLHGVQVGHQTELYEVNTNESDIKGAQKLSHTIQCSFLDKAAVVTDPEADTRNRWRLCTLPTFFISQANIMDRKLASNFIIPAGSVPIFSVINVLILVPVYEKVIVPVLRKHTGHSRGITSLQRIGVVNLAVYVWIAVLYKGRGGAVGGVRSESVFEMGDGVFAGKRRR